MSRNSKNSRLLAFAKQFKRAQNTPRGVESTGNKGPAKTVAKHSKKKAWFQLFDTYREFLASSKKGAAKRNNTKNSSTAVEAADVAPV